MIGSVLIPVFVVAALQQAPVTIVQKIVQNTTGWCSPAIANVVGNVTVNCIGVDPRALKRLNEQLRAMKLDRDKSVQLADEWTTRYKQLETRLSDAGEDSILSRQAEEYLHEGELEKAGKILDQILRSEEQRLIEPPPTTTTVRWFSNCSSSRLMRCRIWRRPTSIVRNR